MTETHSREIGPFDNSKDLPLRAAITFSQEHWAFVCKLSRERGLAISDTIAHILNGWWAVREWLDLFEGVRAK